MEIRTGYMTGAEGIERVRKYDHVVSSDLFYWVRYVGTTREEFWVIADTFGDPRVWRMDGGQWVTHNIWGQPAECEPVWLTDEGRSRWLERGGALSRS